ncbi:translation initiation factor IF-3-like [Adelges cooleyi]|uniref:translation initiation factor IF-3-like n=1 Tax=Adelges cooleyi TaxID=133065 RepID=UPI00217FD7CA|nr:translation initiation factor IF-3-like [Adelges cooleyi]
MIRNFRSLSALQYVAQCTPCCYENTFLIFILNSICLLYIFIKVPKMSLKHFANAALTVLRHQVMYSQPVRNVCQCQILGFKKNDLKTTSATMDNEETLKKKRPKTAPIPKITLIDPDHKLSIVTLDEAAKLCDRRGLKLVKIVDLDTKTQRPVFKMMTANQFVNEDKDKRVRKEEKKTNELKGEKTAIISSRIGQGDLDSKVKNVRKWLCKMYEVRITITGETADDIADNVIKMTEGFSRVVQRRKKGDSVKFQLLPPKQTQD